MWTMPDILKASKNNNPSCLSRKETSKNIPGKYVPGVDLEKKTQQLQKDERFRNKSDDFKM